MSSRHSFALRALPLLLGVLTACARTGAVPSDRGLVARGALIEVANEDLSDLVIYLVRGETPIPLGVVSGFSRRTFLIRPSQLGDGGSIVLGAGARGRSVERLTQPIDVAPGKIVSWTLRAGPDTQMPVVRW